MDTLEHVGSLDVEVSDKEKMTIDTLLDEIFIPGSPFASVDGIVDGLVELINQGSGNFNTVKADLRRTLKGARQDGTYTAKQVAELEPKVRDFLGIKDDF